MKHFTAVALIVLCSCSTGEKQTSDSDSTAAPETSYATTPSQSKEEEPDPIAGDVPKPDPDVVEGLTTSCAPIQKGLPSISRDGVEGSLDSALYYLVLEQGAIQGDLRSITTIDNFLDGDNPTNPRKLMSAVFISEDISDQQSTVYPTLAVFEKGEKALTLITWCVLGTWTGKLEYSDRAPETALTVIETELISGQSAVALQYVVDGFVDIDHTLEYNTVDWYAIAQNQIVKIFTYTSYYKEHVGAGDGDNSSDYEYSIDVGIKDLNSEKLRLVELKTVSETGEPIDLYEVSESNDDTRPDGVYAFNGVYYTRVKKIGSTN